MDIRTAVFLHIPLGLTLEGSEVLSLLNPQLDSYDLNSVLECLSSDASRLYLRQNPEWFEKSREIFETSRGEGIRWVHIGHPEYPEVWRELSQSPFIFSYRGEPVWLNRKLLAVVGSRTPGPDSLLWMQRELAPFLKSEQVAVVSGGARGVDQWAHRLCIDSGQPTVCVLPSGILNPYPSGCERLWEKIVTSGGCLVSTCSLSCGMRKFHFHIRNRWIAGLAEKCFVVEANQKSGSMLTASLANQENRDVCTLPVSPLAVQGRGNLELLSQGATLVRDRWDLQTIWSRANASAQSRAD
jgi:DNA processing protein